MEHHHSPHADDLDALLAVLANGQCRNTLSHLRTKAKAVTTLDDLASDLHSHDHTRSGGAASRLYHVILPKLAAVGAIEYDTVRRTIQYNEHEVLKSWLDSITEEAQ